MNLKKCQTLGIIKTHAPPTDELRKLGHTSLGKEEIACIDRLLEAPLDCGGIKRIHSGNPALDIKNDSIDKRFSSHEKYRL